MVGHGLQCGSGRWGLWLAPLPHRHRGETMPGSERPVVTDPPNNFGSLLLIVFGILSAPAGIVIPLVITGLALLREANGELAFPRLRPWTRWMRTVRLHTVQFCRNSKL